MTTTTNIIYSFQVIPANAEVLKNDITAANEHRKEKCLALQGLKDTLMRPSGKARKGGRAEVAVAEAEVKEANDQCNKVDAAYRAAIEPLVLDLRNKHFRANLSSFDHLSAFDDGITAKVVDAAIKSMDTFNAAHRGQPISITDSNGVEFSITTQHDGYNGFRVSVGSNPYGLGGGDVELRANHQGYVFVDAANDTYIVDSENGRFDFTEATPRNGYKVKSQSIECESLKHTVTLGRVMTALAKLGEHLNATDYSGHFTSLTYKLSF